MLQPFNNVDDFTRCVISSLPSGYLYDKATLIDTNLFRFFRGLLTPLFNDSIHQENDIESLRFNPYSPDKFNTLLDRYIAKYDLIRFGFNLTGIDLKIIAISLFLRLRLATTKYDIEKTFEDFGIKCTITYPDNYVGEYSNSFYGYSRYGTDQMRFVVFVRVTLLNADEPSQYGTAQYGIATYVDTSFINIAVELIKKIFPCYVRLIFI